METLVLVVDDEERMHEVTAAMFEGLGYSMLAARNGDDALAILDANPNVALLFSDVVMPDMNGRALAEEALSRLLKNPPASL